jgi:hypothetical protein
LAARTCGGASAAKGGSPSLRICRNGGRRDFPVLLQERRCRSQNGKTLLQAPMVFFWRSRYGWSYCLSKVEALCLCPMLLRCTPHRRLVQIVGLKCETTSIQIPNSRRKPRSEQGIYQHETKI